MHWLLAFCLLLMPTSSRAISPDEDEAWIESQMGKAGAPSAPTSTQSGYRIPWGELKRFVRQPVVVQTKKGVRRRGDIERVDGSHLYLLARLHGGYAELKLRRDQIVSVERE